MSTSVKFSDIVALLGLEEFTADQISIIRELMSNAGADRGLIERYVKADKPFSSEEAKKLLNDLIRGKMFVGGVLRSVDDVMITTARGACESLAGQLDSANAHFNQIENAAKLAACHWIEGADMHGECSEDVIIVGSEDEPEDEDAPDLDPEEN